jgi:hypothetical protein
MSNVLPLHPHVRQQVSLDLAALAAGLCLIEQAESPDETAMEAIVDAEQDALAALAEARASTLAEVELKLAVLARRADASQGFLSEVELDLLRSVLDDMRSFGQATAVA